MASATLLIEEAKALSVAKDFANALSKFSQAIRQASDEELATGELHASRCECFLSLCRTFKERPSDLSERSALFGLGE